MSRRKKRYSRARSYKYSVRGARRKPPPRKTYTAPLFKALVWLLLPVVQQDTPHAINDLGKSLEAVLHHLFGK